MEALAAEARPVDPAVLSSAQEEEIRNLERQLDQAEKLKGTKEPSFWDKITAEQETGQVGMMIKDLLDLSENRTETDILRLQPASAEQSDAYARALTRKTFAVLRSLMTTHE